MTHEPANASELVHATCVAIGDHGLLLKGPSGAGKSDLALRLIDRGAQLISDDYTLVTALANGTLQASPPENISGKIEIRNVGIVQMPYKTSIEVRLVLDLAGATERMPEKRHTLRIAGIVLPLMFISPFEISAALKAEHMLAQTLTKKSASGDGSPAAEA